MDLRLPKAQRVVSEASLNSVCKTVCRQIAAPQFAQMQPVELTKIQPVQRTLQPTELRIPHRSVAQRAFPTRDFLTFFPTHLLVFFAVGEILC